MISDPTRDVPCPLQYVIEANLVPPLVAMLQSAEFDIRKEAAWAVSNATSGGTPMQIRQLVQRGAIPALCSLLGVQDAKIVSVALEGIENILRMGDIEREAFSQAENINARLLEEAGGREKLEALEGSEHTGDCLFD